MTFGNSKPNLANFIFDHGSKIPSLALSLIGFGAQCGRILCEFEVVH
jgi:hypothetical protein